MCTTNVFNFIQDKTPVIGTGRNVESCCICNLASDTLLLFHNFISFCRLMFDKRSIDGYKLKTDDKRLIVDRERDSMSTNSPI